MVGADHGADEGHLGVQRSQQHLQQLLPAPPARQGSLPGQTDRQHKLQDNMNYDVLCVLEVIIFEAIIIHSQVAALPKGGDIEIEAVAIIGQWRFACLQILTLFTSCFRSRGCGLCAAQ